MGKNLGMHLEYFKEESDNYAMEGLGDIIILNNKELKEFLKNNNEFEIKYIDVDTYEYINLKLNGLDITISVL